MATAAEVARILHRTGFGIELGQIDSLAAVDLHDIIDERLADEGWSLSVDETNARDFEDVQWNELPREWIDRILSPNAGMHERMVWYWHNHFTTNRHETNHRLIWRQHQTIRRHALGNVRDFAHDIVRDGAMLHYLDGAGSSGEAPNENLSREFMELFMLGRNAGYTEDDVRAGARILSGWFVDWETGDVGFDAEQHYSRPVQFLGRRQRWSVDAFVDAVMDQPACAGHIAGRIHAHFVSTPLTDDRRAELGEVLRSNDWEIRPLLSNMLHHDEFTSGAGVRTREPIEWVAGAAAAFGVPQISDEDNDYGFDYWQLEQTAQVPFEPPNVAGWVNDERWSSASQVVARGNLLMHWDLDDRVISRVVPTPEAVLEHCGVFNPTDTTLNAMHRAIDVQTEYDRGLELLLTMALLSPEYATI